MAKLAACFLGLVSISLTWASVAQGETELLFFSSQRCGPCQQMKPLVEHLVAEGYPIRTVDVEQQSDWAAHFQVQAVPTFILVENQQPITRRVGKMPLPSLVEMFREPVSRHKSSSPGAAIESQGEGREVHPTFDREPRGRVTPGAPRATGNAIAKTPAMQRALRATVRIRVHDASGSGVGSGTLIHQRNGEALVLTCGHLFRDSKGQGEIEVEYGFPGRTRVVPGRLLAYEADLHDTALVVIQPQETVEIVPVALRDYVPLVDDQVFSIGCDRGADPSVRTSRIKALTRYSNILKYDVHGRPVDGRSGGGLFTAGGQLIGICNAAAVEVDEGLYAGIPSLHRQLNEVGLGEVFNDPRKLAATLNAGNSEPKTEPHISLIDAAQPTDIPASHVSSTGASSAQQAPVTPSVPASLTGRAVSSHASNQSPANPGRELILLIRDPEHPGEMKSLVIHDPSPELLASLERQAAAKGATGSPRTAATNQAAVGGRHYNRGEVSDRESRGALETRPQIAPPRDQPLYRAQSPR